MKNTNNNWHSFSRGIAVIILIAVIFCGLCGLGAAFSQIPWLLIAGGICLLLIVCAAIWFLGYKSRPVTQPIVQEHTIQQPQEQVIILSKELSADEFNKAYNMFASEDDDKTEEK